MFGLTVVRIWLLFWTLVIKVGKKTVFLMFYNDVNDTFMGKD